MAKSMAVSKNKKLKERKSIFSKDDNALMDLKVVDDAPGAPVQRESTDSDYSL